MSSKKENVEVFNINTPGKSSFVQKDKYDEVKRVLKKLMPRKSPGLTQNEMADLVRENVSVEIFEDKNKSGWWMKTVQLDLEARTVIVREKTKPTRWYFEIHNQETVPAVHEKKKITKKEVLEMPMDLKNLLIRENLWSAFEQRPFYQRNDYTHWITSAKREETKNKRMTQMLEELRDGHLYMNMEYNTRKS